MNRVGIIQEKENEDGEKSFYLFEIHQYRQSQQQPYALGDQFSRDDNSCFNDSEQHFREKKLIEGIKIWRK